MLIWTCKCNQLYQMRWQDIPICLSKAKLFLFNFSTIDFKIYFLCTSWIILSPGKDVLKRWQKFSRITDLNRIDIFISNTTVTQLKSATNSKRARGSCENVFLVLILISSEFAQTEVPYCYSFTVIFFSLIRVLLMTSIRKYFCVGKMRDVLIASVHESHFYTQEYYCTIVAI